MDKLNLTKKQLRTRLVKACKYNKKWNSGGLDIDQITEVLTLFDLRNLSGTRRKILNKLCHKKFNQIITRIQSSYDGEEEAKA